MTAREIYEATELLRSLHLDMKRTVHATDYSKTDVIARLSYVLGEMQAPFNALRSHYQNNPPDVDGAQ